MSKAAAMASVRCLRVCACVCVHVCVCACVCATENGLLLSKKKKESLADHLFDSFCSMTWTREVTTQERLPRTEGLPHTSRAKSTASRLVVCTARLVFVCVLLLCVVFVFFVHSISPFVRTLCTFGVKVVLNDKKQNLRRLEAERNDLNGRGVCMCVCVCLWSQLFIVFLLLFAAATLLSPLFPLSPLYRRSPHQLHTTCIHNCGFGLG